ncbi:odorant receptor 49b-like isoform X2 [Harpegnathos saltator]|uniref:odorant receptor 49b-like isoform X2 n=1 Tax=Harpegnathos saltator TaxID=610380 RepID=UPI0009488B15|nr:odorant receptor 49b-like isoform X2 [Harpegnathos saltator]
MKVLCSVIFYSTLLVKYNAFRVNVGIVKNSLELIQHTCDELQDVNEIDIVKKYGNIARRYTATFTLVGIVIVSIIICIPIWPRIVDIFLPMNESRPLFMAHIMIEYFIDREMYSYLVVLHSSIAISVGAIVEVATGTMLIGYYKHVCAMFKIASYRIEQAMKINAQQYIDPRREITILMMNRIIHAVDIHRKAMMSAEYLITNFEVSFFILIALGVMCLSLNLFRVFQIVSFENDTNGVYLHLIYVNIVLLYMFTANYIAQQITDCNHDVFVTVYNIRWYTAPLQIQKTILFLLQRGTKPFSLTLGGLFVASLKSAATLASTSISYFSVLYSTRH